MKLNLCVETAVGIVSKYRQEAPVDCDPKSVWATSTILAITAIAASLAGAGVAAAGAISQGQSAKDAADFNAKVAANNAQTASEQANFDAEQIRSKNRRIMGAQRAGMAASGYDVDSGSATDLKYDSAMQGEMDALKAIYTGRAQATSFSSQSALDRMRGNQAVTGSYWSAGGSLLTGVSGAAGQGSTWLGNPTFGGSTGSTRGTGQPFH